MSNYYAIEVLRKHERELTKAAYKEGIRIAEEIWQTRQAIADLEERDMQREMRKEVRG